MSGDRHIGAHSKRRAKRTPDRVVNHFGVTISERVGLRRLNWVQGGVPAQDPRTCPTPRPQVRKRLYEDIVHTHSPTVVKHAIAGELGLEVLLPDAKPLRLDGLEGSL